MRRQVLAVLMLLMLCAVAGCGDSGEEAPLLVRQMLSDHQVDGYIARDPATGVLAVTQVARDQVPSVFAGIDPGTLEEFRAFLDFPLVTVPPSARILSATLDLFIKPGSDLPPGGIPVRVELVPFPPPLIPADFDEQLLPPLGVSVFTILRFDVGHHVVLDVTGLMTVAQRYGMRNFQVRVLEQFGGITPGLIEIDDSEGASTPLLKVFFS